MFFFHHNTHHLSLLSRSSQRSGLLRYPAPCRVTLYFRDLIVPTFSTFLYSSTPLLMLKAALIYSNTHECIHGCTCTQTHPHTQMTPPALLREHISRNALSAVYVNRVSHHSALMCVSVFYKCPLLLSKNTVLPVVHLCSPPSIHPSDGPVLGRALTWKRK